MVYRVGSQRKLGRIPTNDITRAHTCDITRARMISRTYTIAGMKPRAIRARILSNYSSSRGCEGSACLSSMGLEAQRTVISVGVLPLASPSRLVFSAYTAGFIRAAIHL